MKVLRAGPIYWVTVFTCDACSEEIEVWSNFEMTPPFRCGTCRDSGVRTKEDLLRERRALLERQEKLFG